MNTTPSSTPHLTSTTASDRPRSDQDQPQVDVTKPARAPRERALVLGGAGSAGNAWEIGVIAGLFEAGLDVTEADLTIGTSAGSTAAAQITSGIQPTELLAGILAAAPRPPTGPVGSDRGRAPIGPASDHMERTSAIIGAAADAADMRRRMGAAALETDAASDSSVQTQWRAVVAARLPSQLWPQRRMLIPAVDAHTGEPVVFDLDSGVDLVDAVAASTSTASASLRTASAATGTSTAATDATRMPIGSRIRTGWCCRRSTAVHGTVGLGHGSRRQVDELARGSRVETIFPDSDAEHMFGANAMDPSLRPPAARSHSGQRPAEQLRLLAPNERGATNSLGVAAAPGRSRRCRGGAARTARTSRAATGSSSRDLGEHRRRVEHLGIAAGRRRRRPRPRGSRPRAGNR